MARRGSPRARRTGKWSAAYMTPFQQGLTALHSSPTIYVVTPCQAHPELISQGERRRRLEPMNGMISAKYASPSAYQDARAFAASMTPGSRTEPPLTTVLRLRRSAPCSPSAQLGERIGRGKCRWNSFGSAPQPGRASTARTVHAGRRRRRPAERANPCVRIANRQLARTAVHLGLYRRLPRLPDQCDRVRTWNRAARAPRVNSRSRQRVARRKGAPAARSSLPENRRARQYRRAPTSRLPR